MKELRWKFWQLFSFLPCFPYFLVFLCCFYFGNTLLLYDNLNHLNMIHYDDTYTHFIYGRTVNDHHPSTKAEIKQKTTTEKLFFNIFTSLQHSDFLSDYFIIILLGLLLGFVLWNGWKSFSNSQKLVFKCL